MSNTSYDSSYGSSSSPQSSSSSQSSSSKHSAAKTWFLIIVVAIAIGLIWTGLKVLKWQLSIALPAFLIGAVVGAIFVWWLKDRNEN